MDRPIYTWLLFAVCLAVVFVAMGWVSVTAVRLERSEQETRRWAALQENVRLALWRMDSLVAPLIAQESTRPYFAYTAFCPAERAYNNMFAELQRGEVLFPSPLLTEQSPQVLLHFQFGPDGELTSPQVPTGHMRSLAESGYTTSERIEAAAARLGELRKTLNRKALLAELRLERPALEFNGRLVTLNAPDTNAQQVFQNIRNAEEYEARGQNMVNMAQQAFTPQQKPETRSSAPSQRELREGILKPIWVGSSLILVRRVCVENADYVQGCLLDWKNIRAALLAETRTLLSSPDLLPVTTPTADEIGHMMAALPVRLVPGALPKEEAAGPSPTWFSLGIAWACVLSAAIGGALVLAGALSLSERRGAFVSAVTHELRTPLTTFKMYAEMLAEDMVPDEAKRRRYLETLRIESVRLGHLVENVLAYARLERGRAASRIETASLEELVARQRDRLSTRAEQAGMQLVADPGENWRTAVRVDTSSLEQILFNLVDNSCKYAARANDRRIHVAAGSADGLATLTVRDHGPGIAGKDARLLFRAFRKSAHEAANSAPGIGLGLALSRRLARQMGGDLRLDAISDGASFTLLLPAA
jgi:two-component sensor histidine kinase